jgi:HD-like signal output (HDOD) protein
VALSSKGQATLALLKGKLKASGDFPSLAESVQSIVDLANNLSSKETALADQVLGDYSLTKKVMTLANSAMYSAFGGSVTNVNQALRVLGTDALSHLAMGLRLLNAFESAAEPSATDGQLELVSAALSGGVARQVAQQCSIKNAEEVAVYTLLFQTGRLLVSMYLPDDWRQIQCDGDRSLENQQAMALLGLTLDDIGQAMGEQWNLPKSLISFSSDDASPEGIKIRMVADAASRISDVLVTSPHQPERLAALSVDLGSKLGLEPEVLAGIASSLLESDERLSKAAEKSRPLHETTAQILAKAMEDLEGIVDVQTYVRKSAEALQQAFRFDRLVTFLRVGDKLKAKFGLGVGNAFMLDTEVVEGPVPSLFFGSLNKNMPVFIRNAADPLIAKNIPSWIVNRKEPAKAFLLIPVQTQNRGLMLMYGEWAKPARAELFGNEERALLGVLRENLSQKLLEQLRKSAS